MKHKPRIIQITCALMLLMFLQPAVGQAESCPLGDYVCLDQHFGLACVNRTGGATGETCAAWLAELQGRPDAGAPEAQLLVGHTLLSLSTFGADRDARASYRNQAVATFGQLVSGIPTYVSALTALSSLVETSDERRDLLVRAVAVDPSDLFVVEQLASAVSLPEFIELYEQTYDRSHLRFGGARSSSENLRWRVASRLASAYLRLAGQIASTGSDAAAIAEIEARRAALVTRAREDLRVEAIIGEIHSAPASDPERTTANLSILCQSDALTLFGAGECMEALAVVADIAETWSGTTAGITLADLVVSTMR